MPKCEKEVCRTVVQVVRFDGPFGIKEVREKLREVFGCDIFDVDFIEKYHYWAIVYCGCVNSNQREFLDVLIAQGEQVGNVVLKVELVVMTLNLYKKHLDQKKQISQTVH